MNEGRGVRSALDERSFNERRGTPYATCALVGLGGLFLGITGPLVSAFLPPLVRDLLGEQRTAIGAILALDNALLLLLVPLSGLLSDRARVKGRGRLPIVLAGLLLASCGMALIASSAVAVLAGLIGSMIVLYTGINLQRAPFQALLVDLVPSRFRSLATGSMTFQMCIGAISFLMLGRMLGREVAFSVASVTVLLVAASLALRVRETSWSQAAAPEAALRPILAALRSTMGGEVPGMRAVFFASFLLQLTFQTFTTWYALHAMERFAVTAAQASVGMIAWAAGGALGALPAGALGGRIGRRNATLLGFALMGLCLFAADRVSGSGQVVPLLALASAAWALPTVNAYPLFVEQVPRSSRGTLTALFLLSMALGGGIGDPLNGRLFDLFEGYRPLFLMMASYTALAFAAVLLVPRGAGEADTGPIESAVRLPAVEPG